VSPSTFANEVETELNNRVIEERRTNISFCILFIFSPILLIN
jgi:hypothetical protein